MEMLVFLGMCLMVLGVDGKYTTQIYLDEYCGKQIQIDGAAHPGGEIHLTRGKGCVPDGCDCNMTMKHNIADKRLKVRFIKLALGKTQVGLCDEYVKISSYSVDPRVKDPRIVPLTSRMCEDLQSSGSAPEAEMNELLLDLKTNKHKNSVLDMFYTVFHEATCEKNEFQCSNIQCVSTTLTCDGYDNCGDKTDEGRDTAKCGSTGLIPSTYLLAVVSLVTAAWSKMSL